MKKLLLSIALISSFGGFAQILSEDFESGVWPPTGWTSDETNALRPWGLCTAIFNATGQGTFIINGTDSAGIGWIAGDNDANLISPSFSLVGYSAAQLSMNVVMGYEYQVDPFPNGDVLVQISTNGGVDWEPIWGEEDYGLYADYDVLALTLDLTPYVGQADVMMKVEYIGNDADSASVDDIDVSGTLSTDNFLASKFSLSPNPANNVVNISNNDSITLSNVDINDINGRTVKTMKVNNLSEVQLNVAELSAGVYFMKINTESGIAVKKFIKN